MALTASKHHGLLTHPHNPGEQQQQHTSTDLAKVSKYTPSHCIQAAAAPSRGDRQRPVGELSNSATRQRHGYQSCAGGWDESVTAEMGHAFGAPAHHRGNSGHLNNSCTKHGMRHVFTNVHHACGLAMEQRPWSR